MKFLKLILILYSFNLFAVVTTVATGTAVDLTKLNVDTDSMKKNLVNDPNFPSTSIDQAKADAVIETNQNEFEQNSNNLVESLYKCSTQKLTVKEVLACKQAILKKK